MTTGKRLTEFGKRAPTPLPPAPGPKRSSQVALLLMGTLAVGGGAYALMPSQTCQPPSPAMADPAVPQPATACTSGSSSGGGSGGSSRSSHWSFFGGDSSSHSSGAGAASSSSSVTRGGFGSFGHGFGFGGG